MPPSIAAAFAAAIEARSLKWPPYEDSGPHARWYELTSRDWRG